MSCLHSVAAIVLVANLSQTAECSARASGMQNASSLGMLNLSQTIATLLLHEKYNVMAI